MPMKCIAQIVTPRERLPETIQSFAARPSVARIRCEWSSAVNEPMIAISSDKKTNGISQEINKAISLTTYCFVIELLCIIAPPIRPGLSGFILPADFCHSHSVLDCKAEILFPDSLCSLFLRGKMPGQRNTPAVMRQFKIMMCLHLCQPAGNALSFTAMPFLSVKGVGRNLE